MSFKKFLLEGRYEHETTTISRAIISAIKDNINKIREHKGGFIYYGDIAKQYLSPRYEGIPLAFSIKVPNIAVSITADNMNTFTRGAYSDQFDLLKVYISMPTARSQYPYILNELIPMLKTTIRHELEHSGQKDISGIPTANWKELDTVIGYFTDPREVAAFVTGLYKKAKTTRKPFTDVINNYIKFVKEKIIRSGYSTNEADRVSDKVKTIWTDYYNKRFKLH